MSGCHNIASLWMRTLQCNRVVKATGDKRAGFESSCYSNIYTTSVAGHLLKAVVITDSSHKLVLHFCSFCTIILRTVSY